MFLSYCVSTTVSCTHDKLSFGISPLFLTLFILFMCCIKDCMCTGGSANVFDECITESLFLFSGLSRDLETVPHHGKCCVTNANLSVLHTVHNINAKSTQKIHSSKYFGNQVYPQVDLMHLLYHISSQSRYTCWMK